MSREYNKKIAEDTVRVIKKGFYDLNGKIITLTDDIEESKKYSRYISSEEEIELNDFKIREGKIEITNESTVEAIQRLNTLYKGDSVLALNFASAKNPGGGYLNGSQAQEESLARSSSLVETLKLFPEMYDKNKRCGTCLYTNDMIYSYRVPLFKDDKGNFINPIFTSFITVPAVNTGVVRERESKDNRNKIHQVMEERIERLIKFSINQNYSSIVLGAFGTGVFKNRVDDVVRYFDNVLNRKGYRKAFDKVTFAIYDTSKNKDTLKLFKRLDR